MLGPLLPERNVLDERAPERDVQDLDAAAHPEDGQPAVERALDELELVGVASRLGRRQVLRRLLAVVAGLDVPAAAERDPGARIEGIVEEGAVHPRQDEGDAARERERTLEADATVVAEVVQAEREADDGFRALPCHLDTYIRGA